MIRIIAALLMLGSATQAQFIADGIDTQTAAGDLRIIDADDEFSRELMVGSTLFFSGEGHRYVNIDAQRGALYLVSLSSGGSACAATFAWLDTRVPPQVTEQFGTCADQVEVTSDNETVSVTIIAFQAEQGFVTFVYDGKTITEVAAGQQNTGRGLTAQAWVNAHPNEVFRDAGLRSTLVDLMGEQKYTIAGEVIGVASAMARDGQWVAGKGCMPRQCDVARGAVAIHEDGRIVVALRTQDSGLEVWGDMSGVPPSVIMDVIEDR